MYKNIKNNFSVISLSLSVISIAVVCLNVKNSNLDSASVLVTILCVLVTVLIGFNIFNYLKFEEYVQKQLEHTEGKVEKEINKCRNNLIEEIDNSVYEERENLKKILNVLIFEFYAIKYSFGKIDDIRINDLIDLLSMVSHGSIAGIEKIDDDVKSVEGLEGIDLNSKALFEFVKKEFENFCYENKDFIQGLDEKVKELLCKRIFLIEKNVHIKEFNFFKSLIDYYENILKFTKKRENY